VILKANERRFLLRELPAWWPDVLADAETQKILHNAKFDLMWMIDHCPSSEGQPVARNIQDTMLKSQLAARYRTPSGAARAGLPALWKPNDLASVLKRYLDVSIGKAINHDETDWTGELSEEMIEYALEDIDYMEPLNRELDLLLRNEGQERAADIEMNVVFGTAWMTLNGMQPDLSLWRDSIEDWREQHNHLLTKHLLKMWPGVVNFGSPKQLMAASAAVLGAPLKSTRKAILKQLAPHLPAVACLLDQRTLATRLKNWGPTFLRLYTCGICNRFHPSWNQIGTETGRFSCSRPNCQQFPRAPEFRRLIRARPGHLIASLDYSAIEVVAAAVYAGDKNLLQACRTGDPHLATAQMISGDTTITKQDPRRQNAKIANFGLLFGGGAQGLVIQARDLFDTVISLDEAQQIIREYYALYPGLRRTRSMAYERCQNGPVALDVMTATGFRRVLEGRNRKPTSILNTRIQTDAGQGLKSSFRYLNESRLLPFIIGQVHDELLFEFPEEHAEAYAEIAQRCMLKGMQEVLGRNAPIHIDINIGVSWL
jgi:DNA polymerase I